MKQNKNILTCETLTINVEWDTDGESVDLPEQMDITNPKLKTRDALNDFIEAHLSNKYDWCFTGFTLSPSKENNRK